MQATTLISFETSRMTWASSPSGLIFGEAMIRLAIRLLSPKITTNTASSPINSELKLTKVYVLPRIVM